MYMIGVRGMRQPIEILLSSTKVNRNPGEIEVHYVEHPLIYPSDVISPRIRLNTLREMGLPTEG